MKHNVDLKKFTIYKEVTSEFHIAVKNEDAEIVKAAYRKFHKSELIPDNLNVPGIRLRNLSPNELEFLGENDMAFNFRIKDLQ